jgi:hypothetical protein
VIVNERERERERERKRDRDREREKRVKNVIMKIGRKSARLRPCQKKRDRLEHSSAVTSNQRLKATYLHTYAPIYMSTYIHSSMSQSYIDMYIHMNNTYPCA